MTPDPRPDERCGGCRQHARACRQTRGEVSIPLRGERRVWSGSRFNGAATGALHAHRRGASPEYVDRSVHVGVCAVSTMPAVERRLALAALPVDGPAFRTGLRGVGRRHIDQRAATFFQLVGEHRGECSPALVEDGSVQTALPRAGSGHSLDVEILHGDSAEPAGDVRGNPVLPVAAGSGDACGEARHTGEPLHASPRAPLASGERALCAALSAIDRDETRGERDVLAGAQREGVGDSAIDADCGSVISEGITVNPAEDRDVPFPGGTGDRDFSNGALDWPRIAKLDPTYSPKADRRPFTIQPLDADFSPDIAEAIVDTLAPRRRVSCPPSKEIAERPVHIPNGLGRTCLIDRTHPIEICPQGRQFSALGCKVDVFASRPEILPPMAVPLLPSDIIDGATNTCVSDELRALFFARREAIAVRAVDHLITVFVSPPFAIENKGIPAPPLDPRAQEGE